MALSEREADEIMTRRVRDGASKRIVLPVELVLRGSCVCKRS
jgi:hypothetical protein